MSKRHHHGSRQQVAEPPASCPTSDLTGGRRHRQAPCPDPTWDRTALGWPAAGRTLEVIERSRKRWSAFLAGHPDYIATTRVDELRATEYSYLDRTGQVYLDYTGAGLPAIAQLRAHADRVSGDAYGNPHSENPPSTRSTYLVTQTREAILAHFDASPQEYAVIFTPNASGACRLVGEAYSFEPGDRFTLTLDNHNSVNGMREFARSKGATIQYLPLEGVELRVAPATVRAALELVEPAGHNLFAFPAQSNFTGVQHPLDWIEVAHEHGWEVLLDAAAFVPTNRLDLHRYHPDFVAVSWYKVFGYPTGVGCLLASRAALDRLHRPWFAGGTIWAVSAQGDWHHLARDESAFEDGTLNFLSIPDVKIGLDWLQTVGPDVIHRRVMCLTGWLLDELISLRHSNGRPVAVVYGPPHTEARGATVAMNFLDPDGCVVDERVVARDASARGIAVRAGCFCNPGAGEAAFRLTRQLLTEAGGRTMGSLDEYLEVLGLPSAGAIRASLGIASTFRDVEEFLRFARETYRDVHPERAGLAPRLRC